MAQATHMLLSNGNTIRTADSGSGWSCWMMGGFSFGASRAATMLLGTARAALSGWTDLAVFFASLAFVVALAPGFGTSSSCLTLCDLSLVKVSGLTKSAIGLLGSLAQHLFQLGAADCYGTRPESTCFEGAFVGSTSGSAPNSARTR